MADVKWIKIATDIFNNKKIRVIESMPEGDSIIVIWFKILMAAGIVNDEGNVYFTKEIPYTDQMLATVFNRPLTTIQLALRTFEEFGMIEIVNDVIHVSNWEKYQNVEGMERVREQTRLRVSRYRELKKLEMQSNICSYCGGVATGFDHIIAVSRGGKDVESNKTPCCIDCNRIKNDKPLIDFLNNNRDRINDSLIMGNTKLTKYVTLCNATNRYTVTQGNATDIDIEEDKERDKEKNIKDSCSEQAAEPPFITLPLNDKSEYPVTNQSVREYKELYPAVNVEQELRNMRGWCLSNPTKRKTKSGIGRFINSWLSKEQNKGNRNNSNFELKV